MSKLAAPHLAELDLAAEARGLLSRVPVLATKIARACGRTEDYAGAALLEVLRFLALHRHCSGPLTPSELVDRAWHEVILCTREYAPLCERVAGRMIHHEPGGEGSAHRGQFDRALRLYATYFGAPDAVMWGEAADRVARTTCGTCES